MKRTKDLNLEKTWEAYRSKSSRSHVTTIYMFILINYFQKLILYNKKEIQYNLTLRNRRKRGQETQKLNRLASFRDNLPLISNNLKLENGQIL